MRWWSNGDSWDPRWVPRKGEGQRRAKRRWWVLEVGAWVLLAVLVLGALILLGCLIQ